MPKRRKKTMTRRAAGYSWERDEKPMPWIAVYQLNGEQPHTMLLLTKKFVEATDLCTELRKREIPYMMVDPSDFQVRMQVVIPIPQPPSLTKLAVERCIAEVTKEPISQEKDWTMTPAEVDDLAVLLWEGESPSCSGRAPLPLH